jgi:hypothetical protein
MSKKDRARVSRQNGAKSLGPVTPEGKATSSQNAAKTEEYANKLALFLPPHHVVLCNEDRQAYNNLLAGLLENYQPVNQLAASVVREIATARWQVERLNHCLTFQWNLAIIDSGNLPGTVAPELAELETMARSVRTLYTSGAVAHRINRQIDQLELRVARYERRLKFIHANFPSLAAAPASTPEAESETQINEPGPTVYITENTPEVINAYKQQFPHCKIVVMPPDDVAKGINIEDDMPVAPRKVA